FLAALALWGCAPSEPTTPLRSTDSPHPSPPPPPEIPPTGSSGAWIWLMVVDQTGLCITGATTQVVSGQHVGGPVTQETPCNVWGYSGGVEYHGLTAGVAMTVRATAPGYATEEKTIYPGGDAVSAIIFEPLPLH
ncbi:MAG TPA: hypothetical protein VIK41_24215, partial [Gemmatimonadaceae bacterium]